MGEVVVIRETNYSAQAIDTLKRRLPGIYSKAGADVGRCYQDAIDLLRDSVKFRLPDGGRLLGLEPKELGALFTEFNRLPYPTVALEYFQDLPFDESKSNTHEPCPERIVVAHEYMRDGERAVAMFTFHQRPRTSMDEAGNESKFWDVVPMARQFSCVSDLHGVSPFGGREYLEKLGIPLDLFVNELVENTADEFGALAEFCAALACGNVHKVDCAPPNKVANHNRRAFGKQPFFTYKTLEIEAPSESSAQSPPMGGTHASPRVHLRRGHIRRLPERTVWVNACVVGNKSLGMVVKDYRVVTESARAKC